VPYVDQNGPELRETIRRESEETRRLLRNLRHVIEQGAIYGPPLEITTEVGFHAARLSRAIQQFTARHDVVDVSGKILYSEYEEVMEFVGNEVRREPDLLHAPISGPHGNDEYQLYRELGFSDQEYEDLLKFKESWQAHEFNPKEAFDEFSSSVVADIMAGRDTIKAEDIVPGVAGVVGIAFNVTFFGATAGAGISVLVASSCTGLAAIATKFSVVRRKLLGRGQ
jgi:hypothetical protein